MSFNWSIGITFFGNIAAYLSVFVWSTTLAFVMKCGNVPPLYLAGLSLLLMGAWHAAKQLRAREGGLASFRAPAGACLLEAFGLGGFRVLAFPAVMMIDPVEASNLAQSWLWAAIICGLLLAGGKLRARHWVSVLCFGAALWATAAGGIGTGHILALGGGLAWAWYVAQSAYTPGRSEAASAIGKLGAGVVIMLLAFIAGNRWAVEGSDWGWLLALLLVPNAGLALWEYGAKHGEPRKAKIGVLFMPVMAVLWIWLLGGVRPDAPDLFAMAAVTAAGLIASPHVFTEARTARS